MKTMTNEVNVVELLENQKIRESLALLIEYFEKLRSVRKNPDSKS